MIKDNTYQKLLFTKLLNSPELKKERQLLEDIFGPAKLWLIEPNNLLNSSLENQALLCQLAKDKKKKEHLRCFRQVLARAGKSRREEEFTCPAARVGICLPLVQGDALYGHLILCNLKDQPLAQSRQLLQALNEVILEKIQKELELAKLYRTIRPRAIALSTIHTIHRLISSSLNMDELLPKIARLTLQVLRARQCLISLKDKKTKRFTVQTFIDNSQEKSLKEIMPKTQAVLNKATRTGNILMKKNYLAVPLIDEDITGVISVFHKINNRPFDEFDREILIALSEQAAGAIKNARLYKEQENMLLGTVKSLSSLLKAKPAYPYIHTHIFEQIALGIAAKMHLSEEDSRNLRYAVMLHDAEKIGIPEEILKKPAHLTGRELKIVKEQPKKSAKILSPLERLKGAILIIVHHHEKFDGSGYPDKLKKEAIPLGARIMAVAESFEAMISRRPYRASTSVDEAIKEIKRRSGTQFDPQVITAFLKFTKDKSFQRLVRRVYYGRAKKHS